MCTGLYIFVYNVSHATDTEAKLIFNMVVIFVGYDAYITYKIRYKTATITLKNTTAFSSNIALHEVMTYSQE